MSGAQGAEPMGSRTATTYESVEGGQNKTKLDIRSKEDEGGIQVDKLQDKVSNAAGLGGPVFGAENYHVVEEDEEEAEDEEEEHIAYEPTGVRAMEALRDNVTNRQYETETSGCGSGSGIKTNTKPAERRRNEQQPAARRLKWVDEGYEMLVFDDEILSSNDQRALNLKQELNQTDILVVVAVNNSESVNWIQTNSRNVKNMICFESSSNLMNRLGGTDIGSVNKDKQITENLRSKGFSTLTCMVKNCGPQILNCLLDPNCRKALQCLNQCSLVDQKHNCLELDAKIPEKPYVPPMTSFRGKELCHDTAEDLFVGWLGELDWSWRVVAGQNPAYDQFPCQYQLFYRGKGKSAFWYEPVFQVRTLEEKLVWRRRRYSVKRGKIPATFRFSVLDNGVVSNEFWTIVDVSDDLSWGLFHYNGAARVAGQSYTGAVLVTPDGSYPAEKEKERLQSALEKCGIKEWELFAVDNCSCENPPIGIPQGSRLHSRISIIEEPDSEEKFN
ncbi:VDE lipocalin domain [Arabidopsis thaliana x Arabidopsis arenosa]|uniref:VDE lipocalin domain n=1 Tax=Arabidopsis thaliana x Arabidopsis arenosa TaxID=1240361 RepID=A0A8T2A5D0_9BRAS|nr:VDE lipocalin domain [Arabidopsis thaliana x Arabidopsis arenosa]